jgi:hypothetical protein
MPHQRCFSVVVNEFVQSCLMVFVCMHTRTKTCDIHTYNVFNLETTQHIQCACERMCLLQSMGLWLGTCTGMQAYTCGVPELVLMHAFCKRMCVAMCVRPRAIMCVYGDSYTVCFDLLLCFVLQDGCRSGRLTAPSQPDSLEPCPATAAENAAVVHHIPPSP